MVPSVLLAAADTFPPHTGLGADNFAPRALKRLSLPLIKMLCKLLCAFEFAGAWPAVLQLVLIVLLPKPDGGRRPIGLSPTV
eukprot:2423738-Karenia_brevis.AAC.1